MLDSNGCEQRFDQVVFACHGDMALHLLKDADPFESEVLGNFRYSNNEVVLHSDASHMPIRRPLWSSWNYNRLNESSSGGTSITYWMNNLQRLATDTDLFVTVNPVGRIDPDKIYYRTNCRHPMMNVEAVDAQTELWKLQGRNRSWFCGSYFGYGFHEDALQSGLAVAEELGGVRRPWNLQEDSGRIHRSRIQLAEAAE